ncbi:MAG: HsdR family type I site-specific deoxyribonuclease, partial [Cypionkella sp.]|nr:HsdR family type I site-specific deoxyribonuclease [Cypionkella sp.]
GKSLTMVMLGRALALDKAISNPRILIVTDRDDLDKQIKDTFKSCELEPIRATSGNHLIELIRNRTPLVTTIINKFDTAAKAAEDVDEDANVFVLVDESHRSQTGRYGGHSQFATRMRRLLPRACYLGFTGTPLLKKEKNTLSTFGGLIHKYAIDEAVADGAVVPLLYEGRLVEQHVNGGVIDKWFDKISEGLTASQKADLKRKFSRMDALSKTGQAIRAKAFDISEHFRQHWQGTGFKAQLVAPSKAAAVRFKEVLDEIGHVTSEIVISPPDDNEGNEEIDKESKDIVRGFWTRMMARYKTEDEYTRQIIDAFKGSGDPEILIVVSKLLTGFDAPRNTVLYVCKSLREHNLLQAIARVNRLYEDGTTEKQFGFIIDYEGLLGELDTALTTYSAFEGFDAADIADAVHDVREEIRKLPQLHDQLWDLFKPVKNKKDMEQFEQFVADEAIRQ